MGKTLPQITGRLLISLLFITSLFPCVVLRNNAFRYGPPFVLLFAALAIALPGLRHKEEWGRLKSFVLTNKIHVATVALFMASICISLLLAGTSADAAYVVGSILVIGIIHTYIPLAVREGRHFLFLMKLLFVVGFSNAAAALVLLFLKWSFGIDTGIFPVGQFATNKLTVLKAMNIPYVMKGLFWQPNLLGMLLSLMLPSGLFLAQTSRRRVHKLIYASGSVLSCITIAGAFAFISLLPVFLTLILFPIISRRRAAGLLRLFVIFSVLAANVVIIGGINVKFLASLPVTSIGRVDRWDAAIPLIDGHPLFGIGPSNVAASLPAGLSAHDTFIDTALGSGLPAMIFYSVFLVNLAFNITGPGDGRFYSPMMLTFLTFFILQFFETQLLGGMSILNFYFLIMAVSYLSLSSSGASRGLPEKGGMHADE